jgi:hypothetical protein
MLYLPWQSANPYHAAHAKIEFADMLCAQDPIGTCKLYPSMIEMERGGGYRDVPAQTTHLDVLYFFLHPTANFLIEMIMNNQLNRERPSTTYCPIDRVKLINHHMNFFVQLSFLPVGV